MKTVTVTTNKKDEIADLTETVETQLKAMAIFTSPPARQTIEQLFSFH